MATLIAPTLRPSTTPADGWHPGLLGCPGRRDRGLAITVIVSHTTPLVRAGLLSVLGREAGFAVSEEPLAQGEADHAVAATGRAGHRVLIADHESAMDFLSTSAEFADPERPRVLIVTRHETGEHVSAAMNAGADGYFVLGGPVTELVDCIRALADGRRRICEVATQRQAALAITPTFQERRAPQPARTLDPDALNARLSEGRLSEVRLSEVRDADAERARPVGGLAPGALRRVREHVEHRLAEKIELRELAAIAKLSECHFSRAFKQSVGMPPHRYLLLRRIDAASELIRTTDRSLTEISLDLGFSDQSHFTRTFSRTTGETPRAFRYRHR